MDSITNALRELNAEMKRGFERSNQNNGEIIKELDAARKAIQSLQDEMKLKEQKWEKEKKNLTEKIEKLENIMEKKEKRERENNIVIKNAKLTETGNELVTEVANFIKCKLNKKAEIKQAIKVNENCVIATLRDREQKTEVMKERNKLIGTNIFIDNDMTRTEREIQWELRQIAKEEREKGKTVKVGYQKLIVNNKEWKWQDFQKVQLTKN